MFPAQAYISRHARLASVNQLERRLGMTTLEMQDWPDRLCMIAHMMSVAEKQHESVISRGAW